METTELINVVQKHLDNELAAEVVVSGDEDRPVPAIFLEDWSIEQIDSSMTRYLTSEYDDQGNETARVYRIPYNCRVSFLIRDRGEVSASRLHDKLRRELFKLETRPSRLGGGISRVSVGNGGGVDHQFVNPSEAEFSQSASFTSSIVYKDTNYDTIESFTDNIEIVDLI